MRAIPPASEMDGPAASLSGDTAGVFGGPVTHAAPPSPDAEFLFSSEAMEFLALLVRQFEPRRRRLMAERRAFSDQLRQGRTLEPPGETRSLRESDWTVPPPPAGLEHRWVEVVGPPDARAIVEGMNSRANAFVADFEDLHSPTWPKTVAGQVNLAWAARRSIEYTNSGGSRFRLARLTATLVVRPRGWHLLETHASVDGEPVSAALFDFGLYAFHNARALVNDGAGVYLCLPKLEHYAEASLWNDVFLHAEHALHLPVGAIRASATIETWPATVEMDEILFSLRAHGAGLGFAGPGCAFSYLKQYRNDAALLPSDRSAVDRESSFAFRISRRLVRTCHRRGAAAVEESPFHLLDIETGGPRRPEVGRELADKVRAARAGFDGTWVVDPVAVPAVQEFFAGRRNSRSTESDPGSDPEAIGVCGLPFPEVPVTMETLRSTVRASLRYLDARLRGVGSVVVDQRVEDLSTVEVSRTLLWTWIRFSRPTNFGGPVSASVVREILGEETMVLLEEAGGDSARGRAIDQATRYLDQLVTDREFCDYLSWVATPE